MTEQNEFEKWFVGFYIKKGFITSKSEAYEIWNEARQQQAADLAALRGFAELIINKGNQFDLMRAERFNLIDENGNPTPLLTGESE